MKCGFCDATAVAWLKWRTIGRPKGSTVCKYHLYKMDVQDNFGDRPVVKWLL